MCMLLKTAPTEMTKTSAIASIIAPTTMATPTANGSNNSNNLSYRGNWHGTVNKSSNSNKSIYLSVETALSQ